MKKNGFKWHRISGVTAWRGKTFGYTARIAKKAKSPFWYAIFDDFSLTPLTSGTAPDLATAKALCEMFCEGAAV